MMKKGMVFSLALGIFFVSSMLMAASKKPKVKPAPPEIRKPIVMKWTTLEGMRYYYLGLKIDDSKSMRSIISPLNDSEANRLLKVSSDSESSGVVFLVGGGVLTLGGLIGAASGPVDGDQVNTGQAIGIGIALLGLVGDYIGIFKLTESETAQFSAVQRYNQVVHGDTDVSWNYHSPSIQADLLAFKF